MDSSANKNTKEIGLQYVDKIPLAQPKSKFCRNFETWFGCLDRALNHSSEIMSVDNVFKVHPYLLASFTGNLSILLCFFSSQYSRQIKGPLEIEDSCKKKKKKTRISNNI